MTEKLRILSLACASLFLTVLIVVGLEVFLPDFLAAMLLGNQTDSYPITFQTCMWLPFSIGLVCLAVRYDSYIKNINYFNSTKFEEGAESLNSVEQVEVSLKSFGSIDKSVNIPVYLHAGALSAIIDSSRYNDIKEEISSTSELIYASTDSSYSKIKYIAWLLPSLGFMGTVYGISISVAGFGALSPDDPDMLSKIAGTLAIAFDTTLLSLIQSSGLILLITFMENMENDFIAKAVVRCQKLSKKILRSVGPKRELYSKAS